MKTNGTCEHTTHHSDHVPEKKSQPWATYGASLQRLPPSPKTSEIILQNSGTKLKGSVP